jgi:Plasmid pRiA4b ORF-3-like protein
VLRSERGSGRSIRPRDRDGRAGPIAEAGATTRPAAAVVDAAYDCQLLTRARAVAVFVGTGRPVTAKAVLRRPDIPAACEAAGLPDPGRVVSAAHVPALHRAWTAAQGAELLMVGAKHACTGTTTGDPVETWRHGITAVLRAESDDPERRSATLVCAAALDVLIAAPGLPDPRFGDALEGVLDLLPLRDQVIIGYAFRRGLLPETGAIEVLAECGAVDPVTRTVTPLGQWARRELDRPPAPRTAWADDDVLELRIDLDRFRPPVWRRVRLPATTTLTQLHEIIQVLFEWDGDHLHVFTVDGRHYADPFHDLPECADSDQLTLADALPRAGARLSYRYDPGDCWDHTVLLENGGPATTSTRPTCVGGRGDAPVEDWPDEEPPPPRPLDLAALDRQLARQASNT